MIFLDTGIFVAWLVRSDRLHAPAAALFRQLPPALVTSLAVFSEGYSYFLYRFDEQRARYFRSAIAELPGLALLPIDAAHHAAVERKLDQHRGRKLTYVDASSLVFLQRRRIRTVWGSDRDLTIEGATLLP